MKGRRSSKYGKGFLAKRSLETTAVGLFSMRLLSAALAVSKVGRSVSNMPPADRKSGMPAPTLMPAPVRKTTLLHWSLAMNSATRSSSCSGFIPGSTPGSPPVGAPSLLSSYAACHDKGGRWRPIG